MEGVPTHLPRRKEVPTFDTYMRFTGNRALFTNHYTQVPTVSATSERGGYPDKTPKAVLEPEKNIKATIKVQTAMPNEVRSWTYFIRMMDELYDRTAFPKSPYDMGEVGPEGRDGRDEMGGTRWEGRDGRDEMGGTGERDNPLTHTPPAGRTGAKTASIWRPLSPIHEGNPLYESARRQQSNTTT